MANLIAKVENGVDEFRNYLEKRGRQRARSLVHGPGVRRKKRQATESQKANVSSKDALDDALGDLNRSTNRLRRKFDPTDKWDGAKSPGGKVVDDGRKINQVVARVWRTADGDLTNQASRIGRSVVFKGHSGLVVGATVRSIARPDNDTAKKELIGMNLGDCW